MKFFVVGFALLAAACVAAELLPSSEYLPPVQELSGLEQDISLEGLGLSGALADDGYRYKTVRRLRLRHRRDVNELPSSEYLPPVQQQVALPQISQLPVQQLGLQSVSSIGLPSNEYLAPLAQAAPVSQIASGVLADDGYRYKTVRRLRLRHRRDVNELPSSEYLPPVQQQVALPQISQLPVQQLGLQSVSSIGLPSNEYLAPLAQAAPVSQIASGVLADDGYRYKTVRRLRLRHRRDVNELPSSEYLPPVQQQVALPQISQLPVQQLGSLSGLQSVSSVGLGLPSNEYLAPLAQAAPVSQIASGVLADDGYRYKTVRRLRLRHRRSSELPSVEYLPPVQQQVVLPQISQLPVQQLGGLSGLQSVSSVGLGLPSNEYLAPLQSNVLSGVLADDGYRYKTVKKIKRRH